MSVKMQVGFLGAGMMASALIDGIVARGVRTADQIHCADVYAPARDAAAAKGYRATPSNADVAARAGDAVFLAVKPHCVAGACADVDAVPSEAVVVSIAAGVTLAALEAALPGRRVIRVSEWPR